jgi:hypothetical protein
MLVFVDFVELVVHVYDFVATANGPLRRARVADGFGCVLQSCPLDRTERLHQHYRRMLVGMYLRKGKC